MIIAQLEMNRMIEIDVETMPTSVDVSRTKSRVAGESHTGMGLKERSNANRRAPSRGIAPLWSVTNERAAVTIPCTLLRNQKEPHKIRRNNSRSA